MISKTVLGTTTLCLLTILRSEASYYKSIPLYSPQPARTKTTYSACFALIYNTHAQSYSGDVLIQI